MSTLEFAASLLTFDSGPIEQTNQEQTLSETASKILSMMSLEGVCFYLINEEDASFSPAYCEPAEYQPEFEIMVDHLIENQTFAWALGRNKAVRVEVENSPRPLLLHTLATASRTRGMFLGLPIDGDDEFESPLPLLTVILHSCANILESFELYHRMRQMNNNLEQRAIDLQLAHDASEKSDHEKDALIAELEQKAMKLQQEAERLFNTELSPDQVECTEKLRELIKQMLDKTDSTAHRRDHRPVT